MEIVKNEKCNNSVTITTSELTEFRNSKLPVITGSLWTYIPDKNLFLTRGYTSRAGNTYYQVIQASERLIVCYDIGEGYKHTFLNGIKIFGWNGRIPQLICSRKWGGLEWKIFNEKFAKSQTKLMLKNHIKTQLLLSGKYADEQNLLSMSESMINSLYRKIA